MNSELPLGHPFATSIPRTITSPIQRPHAPFQPAQISISSLPQQLDPNRPQLRINTSLPSPIPRAIPNQPPLRRPIPIRHPGLVGTAPPSSSRLHRSSPRAAHPYQPAHPHREMAVMNTGYTLHVISPPPEIDHAPDLDLDLDLSPTQPSRGHRRTLSNKLKTLLHLYPTKRNVLPTLDSSFLAPDSPQPRRPHRSPGTASYMVSRQVASASTTSTFSIVSKPSWAEKVSIPELISHFSNPTTVTSSIAEMSQSQASGIVPTLEMEVAEEHDEDTEMHSGRVRRSGSMVDLRKVKTAWLG
ncbi:hypothetical protein BCR39DRAFT_336088 [Naematelia encephala]|uniref:Uncharacterized protein n=1 Tax=Naematelia encephala TaxID=71784 RepID=A0A1Y2AQA6_9TREE|nr:hypothetical protein BCR39DRAFT_336088 [Naematelia encephala]